MNVARSLRIEWAVARYDFWMDSRGVPRRARKGFRDELRANLADATEHEGSRAAVLAIGSPHGAGLCRRRSPRGTPPVDLRRGRRRTRPGRTGLRVDVQHVRFRRRRAGQRGHRSGGRGTSASRGAPR